MDLHSSPTFTRITRFLAAAAALVISVPAVSVATAGSAAAATSAPAFSSSASSVVPAPAPAAVPVGGRLPRVLAAAKRGVAARPYYSSGGGHGSRPAAVTSPTDCSGFVRAAYWEGFGIDIGSGSGHSMVYSGKFHRVSNPVPGDVVSFSSYGAVFHVNIYAGRVNGVPSGYAQVSSGTPARLQNWASPWYMGVQVSYWRLNAATAADLQTTQRTALSATASTDAAGLYQPVRLSGQLTANGRPGPATYVALYARTSPSHGWTYRGPVRTDSAGRWAVTVSAGRTPVQYHVRFNSRSPQWRPSVSPGVLVKLRAAVQLGATPASLVSSRWLPIRASMPTAYAGSYFVVQRLTTAGWRNVRTGVVQASGLLSSDLRLLPGVYGIRVVVVRPQVAWTATTISPAKRVVIT